MNQITETWIPDFLDAVQQGLSHMDLTTLQPIDCFDIFPLYAKEGTERILKMINLTSSYNPSEIAPLLHSPSVIRAEMLLSLIKAKIAGMSKEKVLALAHFYYSLLQSICPEDPFALHGTNRIHSSEQINSSLSNLHAANPNIAKALGQLSNACYHLAYSLYSDINPQICYDTFGPYDVSAQFGQGHILIIKQFQNLHPIKLWQDNLNKFSLETIRIYCIYKDIKFSMDNATHSHYEGNLLTGLQYYNLEINGEMVNDLAFINNVTEKIGLKAMDLWQTLTSLDFEHAKIKYLEQRCYNYANLCTSLNIDWHPTIEMLKAVKDKPLAKNFWPIIEDSQESHLFWRELVDPRIDSQEFWKKWRK